MSGIPKYLYYDRVQDPGCEVREPGEHLQLPGEAPGGSPVGRMQVSVDVVEVVMGGKSFVVIKRKSDEIRYASRDLCWKWNGV